MDLIRVKEKAGELLNKIAGTLRALTERFPLLFDLGHFLAEKRRIVVFVSAGALALFLILIIAVVAAHSGGSEKSAPPINSTAGPAIPAGEFFMPGEPDFVPKFIPGREPRSFWSVEEIRPYWKIPDKSDRWREEIKSTVDKLMEAVP